MGTHTHRIHDVLPLAVAVRRGGVARPLRRRHHRPLWDAPDHSPRAQPLSARETAARAPRAVPPDERSE